MRFNILYQLQIGFRKEYGDQDNDTLMFLEALKERPPARVLEIGANEEASAQILSNVGFQVTGIDLLPEHKQKLEINYQRIVGDFVQLADGLPRNWDVIYSTSAIEHFGCPVYGAPVVDQDYDIKALCKVYDLLKPGGRCYLTVPYGQNYIYTDDWRIYNRQSLQDRLIGEFQVETKSFFLSGECTCPHQDSRVKEEDADSYHNISLPHVTVLLVLRKPRELMVIDEGGIGFLPEDLVKSTQSKRSGSVAL